MAALAVLLAMTSGATAQGEQYRLVPNWPTLPAGMWFGLQQAPPPPAEREAQAAARRARGQMGGGGGLPTNQPGISGLAIDQQDRIYVFNRGPKPVMIFDTAGGFMPLVTKELTLVAGQRLDVGALTAATPSSGGG